MATGLSIVKQGKRSSYFDYNRKGYWILYILMNHQSMRKISELYRVCMKCKAHVKPQLPPFGRCSRSECEMMQRFEECTEQISAKVMFKRTLGNVVTAFGDIVKKMADVPKEATVSEADLMLATLYLNLKVSMA